MRMSSHSGDSSKRDKNYEDIITWNTGRNTSVQLRNNGTYRRRLFGRQQACTCDIRWRHQNWPI